MARNLRLQVILNAVDQATRPLRSIDRASQGASQAMRASRDELRSLQQQQKDVSGYRQTNIALRQNQRALRDAQARQEQYSQALEQQRNAHVNIKASLTTARREYDRFSKAVINAKNPNAALSAELEKARIRLNGQQQAFDKSSRSIKQYRDRTRHTDEQVKKLTRTHDTNAVRLTELRNRLNNAGISTDNLGRSARQLRQQESQLNATLDRQRQRLEAVAAQQRRLTAARDQHQRTMSMRNSMAGTGAGMVASGGSALYAGARLMAPGVSWAEQMSTLQAVGRFTADDERYQALRQQSRELGGSTAFSATEVGSGQEFLLRAGMSSEAIRASMRDVLDLALANNTELGRAADIASNIAGAFKVDMEADGSMARVADILSGTASRANVNLEMLGETMKYLGGAEDLKLTMEQAAAMSGILGNIGIQGSQAGTTMRAMMNRLTNPAAKGAAAIENMGLRISDANGNMRAMPEILRDISQATADLGNVERKAIMQDIFGVEAGSGMAELVNAMGDGQLDAIINALGDNMGENARMASTMADNIGGDLKGLRSAWEEVGISITDTNNGPLRDLIQNVTAITRGLGRWINENPRLAGTITKVAAILAVLVTAGGMLTLMLASILGPIAMVRFALTLMNIRTGAGTLLFKALGKTILLLAKGALSALLVSLKTLGFATLATLKFIGAVSMGLRALGAILWAVAKGIAIGILTALKQLAIVTLAATKSLTLSLLGALKAVGIAALSASKAILVGLLGALKATALFLATNPIGWAVMAIAGAVFLIIKYWEPIKAFFQGLWQQVNTAFGEGIGAVAQLLANWSPLGLLYRGITTALTALGVEIPEQFRSLGSAIVDGLMSGLSGKLSELRESVVGMAGNVRGWFANVLDINSPSRVFTQLGGYTVDGLNKGLDAQRNEPARRIQDIARRVTRAGAGLALGAAALPAAAMPSIEQHSPIQFDNRPPLTAASTQASGFSMGDININVTPAPGMNEQQLAQYVAQEVQRALTNAQRDAQARQRSSLRDLD